MVSSAFPFVYGANEGKFFSHLRHQYQEQKATSQCIPVPWFSFWLAGSYSLEASTSANEYYLAASINDPSIVLKPTVLSLDTLLVEQPCQHF